MTYKLFKYVLVGKLILSVCSLQGDSSPPQKILVILADDMGWALPKVEKLYMLLDLAKEATQRHSFHII